MGDSGDGEERKLREEHGWRRWWTGGLGSWGHRRRIGEDGYIDGGIEGRRWRWGRRSAGGGRSIRPATAARVGGGGGGGVGMVGAVLTALSWGRTGLLD